MTLVAAVVSLAFLATACGSGSSTTNSGATPTTTGSGPATSPGATTRPNSSQGAPGSLYRSFRLVFEDTASNTACPAAAPSGAECFELAAESDVAPYGKLGIGPMFDLEVPEGTAECGAPAIYSTQLSTATGQLDVVEGGPRLCIGALETVKWTFRVTGGTGSYLGATGGGTVTIDAMDVGATETWVGRVVRAEG